VTLCRPAGRNGYTVVTNADIGYVSSPRRGPAVVVMGQRNNMSSADTAAPSQSQYPALDYKFECNLGDRRGRAHAEFTKD
jgi:hypothetical protein